MLYFKLGGKSKLSIWWITPLLALISGLVILAVVPLDWPSLTYTLLFLILTWIGSPCKLLIGNDFNSSDLILPTTRWYFNMSTKTCLFLGLNKFRSSLLGTLANASSVGAKMVNCSPSSRVFTSPPASKDLIRVLKLPVDLATSMRFLPQYLPV